MTEFGQGDASYRHFMNTLPEAKQKPEALPIE
jgi:hypothetical protein